MTAKTSLAALRARVEDAFSAALSPATLEQFVERLHRLGLLADDGSAQFSTSPHAGRIRGDALYLRLKAFDPDPILDRLVGKVRFFFTRYFVASSAALILFAFGLTVANWREIAEDIQRLYNVQSLLIAWVTVFLVIIAHEFAHGVTCKYHGASVHEMGFLFLYFQPTFYCNVSDAWLFPEKSKRLWVSFAGAYFELFLWAFATLAWRVTDRSTVLNHLALVVMATSGVKSLFNLNPLIKLDGYYLLSDYLDIPNLRQRAFRYLRSRIKQLWGSRIERAMEATARERYVDEGQAVAKDDVIAQLSGRDYRAELQKLGAETDEKQAKLKMLKEGTRPEEIQLARAGVATATTRFDQARRRFEEAERMRAERLAKAESTLKKGEERLKYGITRRDLFDRLYLRQLVSLLQFEEAKEEVAVREKELEEAGAELKLILADDLAELRKSIAVAENEWKEAEGKLKLALAGSRPEEIEAVEAEIARLKSQRAYLEEQLQRVTIVSPIAGIITTPKPREKVGQHVTKGDLVAEVHELGTVTAEIAIPEKEIADVRLGAAVALRARAFPGVALRGTVASIAPIVTNAVPSPAERTVAVTTRLDNPALLLKPDMTGNAKISCGERRLFDLMTRTLVRFLRVDVWTWW